MFYLVFITERCNLACRYCESWGWRVLHGQDFEHNLDALIAFLRQDPEVKLKLYGGEPLLRPDLILRLLQEVSCQRVILQTNATLLDNLGPQLFDLVDVVSLSLDGPAELTDSHRGRGVYAQAAQQAQQLRARGYRGLIDVRLTISPGDDVERAVGHFVDEPPVDIDRIYWQLDVQFNVRLWQLHGPTVAQWLRRDYARGLAQLADLWLRSLARGQYLKLVPFACQVHDLITGRRAHTVRCGAGDSMWGITPDGKVFACPTMHEHAASAIGDVASSTPHSLQRRFAIGEPCLRCAYRPLCGGRCLYSNVHQHWGRQGLRAVCSSVRALIKHCERMAPMVEQLVAEEVIALDDLNIGEGYEVIP